MISTFVSAVLKTFYKCAYFIYTPTVSILPNSSRIGWVKYTKKYHYVLFKTLINFNFRESKLLSWSKRNVNFNKPFHRCIRRRKENAFDLYWHFCFFFNRISFKISGSGEILIRRWSSQIWYHGCFIKFCSFLRIFSSSKLYLLNKWSSFGINI